MRSVTMDMIQYDCPFIDTTDDHGVAFSTIHWDFDTQHNELETHMVVEGDDRGAITHGLGALREHTNMHDFDLLSRWEDEALIRTTIAETNAMSVIRDNGGYITGPFEIRDGSETWRVGFDREDRTDRTLSELEYRNDFEVKSRGEFSASNLADVVRNANAATSLLQGCRELSPTEQSTLKTAMERGYFESPRETTLGELAEEFGVSKTAVSKNLRRGEQKLMRHVVGALDDIED